jgi:hypothetical protein
MRSKCLLLAGLVLLAAAPVRADDDTECRAVVARAIKAMGGEAVLSKYKAYSAKMKGDFYMGETKLPFTGEIVTQGPDQQKIALEIEAAGQKFPITLVLNRDRGWTKIGADTVDMDKEKIEEIKEEIYAGWVETLVPLKDKAFKLAPLGESQVGDKPMVGVRVSREGHRDVNLYFDKKTSLVVKAETRVKDDTTGQEVTQETFYSGYDGKEIQSALKLTIKRDGKPYLEADLSDVKMEEKVDDSVFARP